MKYKSKPQWDITTPVRIASVKTKKLPGLFHRETLAQKNNNTTQIKINKNAKEAIGEDMEKLEPQSTVGESKIVLP